MSEQNDRSGGGRRRPNKRRRRGPTDRGGPRHRGHRAGGKGQGRGSVVENVPEGEASLEVKGVLQLSERGHGHLRTAKLDFKAEREDTVVPRSLIRELALETGAELEGLAVPAPGQGRAPTLAKVRSISGVDRETWAERRVFKELIAESPNERIHLEAEPEGIETRVVDLITPIGKGQRCLIVAPPKAGKTVLLQKIAHSISTNHPEIHLIVLLINERPEEVTDMKRTVRGEVVASSSDEATRDHVQLAEIVLERCKRLVECGRDVVVLLDSITRLARAYNSEQKSSGRVLSGGIDARTMEKPRRFFGAARNIEDGGSLTVIATALVDTGSRMDEVIFQEFKGTGNTGKEEMLLTPDEYKKVILLRRALAPLKPLEAMRLLTERMAKLGGNREFLASLA